MERKRITQCKLGQYRACLEIVSIIQVLGSLYCDCIGCVTQTDFHRILVYLLHSGGIFTNTLPIS